MKKIEIYINGQYAYTTAERTIKAAIAHLREVGEIKVASAPNHWTLSAQPTDKVTGRIIGEI